MSSELERLLREAREALPSPDEPSTHRARIQALGSLRRKRRRTRALVLVGATLVIAVAFAVTAGSLNAPSGTAAREPAILGFVPEPGWFALQSPPPAIQGQLTVAAAANVPFAADDVDDGLVEPSSLPYSTLLTLPPDGIVIVAAMTPHTIPHIAPIPTATLYPHVDLPLQLRDALPILRGATVRPDQPTAQYQLGASLRGYNVDVIVYFGTSRPSAALMREAQRQLNGFVVRSEGGDADGRRASVTAPAGTRVVIDQTLACSTVPLGGLYQVELRAHAGDRVDGQWVRLPYVGVSTGGNGGRPDTSFPPVSSLAWITSGAPSPQTTIDDTYDAFSAQIGGTLGRNTDLCRPATAHVTLSRAGLRGGQVQQKTRTIECAAPRRVVIRLRATTVGSGSLRERGRIFAATSTPIIRAELAVRTPAGKPLVYAAVDQSGRSRQYTAPRTCVVEQ